MSRIFNRVLTFHVEGEILNDHTSPESILNNYNWSFKDNMDGNIQLFAHHKDPRGSITKMTKLPKIHAWKKADKEMFALM